MDKRNKITNLDNNDAMDTTELKKELQENLLNYIKQNPFKLITGFSLVIGGFFLLIYFWHVEYFPSNIKFEDIFLVLLLSCIVGILFIAIILLTLIFPVINYQSCKKLSLFEKRIKEKYLKSYEVKRKSKSFYSLMLTSCVQALPIQKRFNPQFQLLLLPLSFAVGLFACLTYYTPYDILSVLLITMLLTLISIFWVSLRNFKRILPNIGPRRMLKSAIFYIYLKKVLFSVLLMPFSFIITFPILVNSPELKNNEILLFLYTIMFMFSFLFLNIIEQNFVKRVTFNPLILLTFLFITKTLYIIPSITLKEFNLAQVTIDKISIDTRGCKIINPDSNSSQCIEKNIKLVWKVGGLYVFDKPLDNNFTTFERYEIPQEFILSRQQTFKITN